MSDVIFIYIDFNSEFKLSVQGSTRNSDEIESFDAISDFIHLYSTQWLCSTAFDYRRAVSYIAAKGRRGLGNAFAANFDDPFNVKVVDVLERFKSHQDEVEPLRFHDPKLTGLYLFFANHGNTYDRPFQEVDNRWYMNPGIKDAQIVELEIPITVDFL